MSYKIYFSSSTKISAVGKIINLKRRTKEELKTKFSILEKELKKLKLNTETKIIVTEEVDYKEENVELFIGYLNLDINSETIQKIKQNKYLTLYSIPTMDYLVSEKVNIDDINNVCNDIIKYSKDKNVQLIGPYTEIYYDQDKPNIYVMAHDLVREEYENELIKRYSIKKYNEPFKLNKEILGTWKIKEILPNINFNYKKQKSNPKTEYNKIEFKDDGTTNHKDLKWSNDNLFLITKDHVVANKMIIKNIDNKKYLEIRMSELSKVYYHAKPISYIYEREEK